MAVSYRDNTPFEGDNHTVGELAEAIRTKMYGVDVRESIAQAVEKMENWTKGNNIGNIIATPTKVFANLSALQSAYPNGADGVMVTVDNGHKYFWSNNQWTDGGAYQAASSPSNSATLREIFSDDTLNDAYTDLNDLATDILFTQVNSYSNAVKSKMLSLHYPECISGARMGIYNFYRDGSYPLGAKMQVLVSEKGVFTRALSATNGTWTTWSIPFEVGARKAITDGDGFVFDKDSVFDDYKFSLSGIDGGTGLPLGGNTRLTSNKLKFSSNDILNVTNPHNRKIWAVLYYKDGSVAENGVRSTDANLNFSSVTKEVAEVRLVVAYPEDTQISDKDDLLKDLVIQKIQSEKFNISTRYIYRKTSQTISSTVFAVPVNFEKGDVIHFSLKSSASSSGDVQVWNYSESDRKAVVSLDDIAFDGTWFTTPAKISGSSINFYLPPATPNNVSEKLTANVYIERDETRKQDVLPTAALRFGALGASNDDENILFFSDTHSFQNNGDDVTDAKKALDVVESVLETTPIDVVLDGGDWLNNSHDKAHARTFLGYVASRTDAFAVAGINALGNHDTNYQRLDGQSIVASSDYLSRDELKGILFRKQKNTYFKTKLRNTAFYTLDTGIDWDQTSVGEYTGNMDAFAWNQLDWFANDLMTADETHSAVHLHIWYNIDDGTMGKFAVEIGKVIAAYNNRQSLTLNNKTYDFTQCDGRVEFVLAGHVHKDLNAKIGNVPVVMIINNGFHTAFNRFDLIKADYVNRKLYCVRFGEGNDRTFDLDTGEKL